MPLTVLLSFSDFLQSPAFENQTEPPSISLDSKDKEDFEELCASLDFAPSEVIQAFIKYIIKEKKMPFDIQRDSCSKVSQSDKPLKAKA